LLLLCWWEGAASGVALPLLPRGLAASCRCCRLRVFWWEGAASGALLAARCHYCRLQRRRWASGLQLVGVVAASGALLLLLLWVF
jgi:hypothetical protein